MKNKPLISIIVPVYNVERYVLRCLDSLSCQRYKNIEIIIVDDGSTDDSGKICDEFSLGEERARVFHKKNGGLSDARNFGIKKAKGKIIALVDSDDFVKDNYVSRMYDVMEREGSDVVICGYDKQLPREEKISGEKAAIRLLVEQNNTDIVAWNKLYKKELFEEINYPVGEKHEDALTTYKILAKAKIVSYLAESLYYYEEREGSIVKSERPEERLNARERATREAIEFFKNNKKLKAAAEVSLLLAKYAYLDAVIKKEIDGRYYYKNLLWIKKYMNDFKDNKYMTSKLKLYNILIKVGLYKTFRKIV